MKYVMSLGLPFIQPQLYQLITKLEKTKLYVLANYLLLKHITFYFLLFYFLHIWIQAMLKRAKLFTNTIST
jgi:hypothetical protein